MRSSHDWFRRLITCKPEGSGVLGQVPKTSRAVDSLRTIFRCPTLSIILRVQHSTYTLLRLLSFAYPTAT